MKRAEHEDDEGAERRGADRVRCRAPDSGLSWTPRVRYASGNGNRSSKLAEISLADALKQRRTVRQFSKKAVALEALERLIWAAQGITGDQSKRTAPSAHSLHPLRMRIVADNVSGLAQGLYDVSSADLSLTPLDLPDTRSALREASIGSPAWITDAACIIVVCADMLGPIQAFSEQRPYGARGARYVYLEAGAALQNIQLQAVAEGLGSVWVGGFDDGAVASALGLKAPLSPIILLCVGWPD
jgi:SagB-type dehydrogenase family enzyme